MSDIMLKLKVDINKMNEIKNKKMKCSVVHNVTFGKFYIYFLFGQRLYLGEVSLRCLTNLQASSYSVTAKGCVVDEPAEQWVDGRLGDSVVEHVVQSATDIPILGAPVL